MIKKTILLLIVTALITSCSSDRNRALDELSLKEQAEAYAAKYRTTPFGFPPVLVVYKQGLLKETLYFDTKQEAGRIGYAIYATSPFEQFFSILKEKSDIKYPEAKDKIRYSLHSYYGTDCPSITEALHSIGKTDLNYKHAIPYNYNPDRAIYKYSYVEKGNGNISHDVTTYIAEHPISGIYRTAKNAISECPHPKVPKYFKQQ